MIEKVFPKLSRSPAALTLGPVWSMFRFTAPSPLCHKLLQGKNNDSDTLGLSSKNVKRPTASSLLVSQCPFIGRIHWVYLQVCF